MLLLVGMLMPSLLFIFSYNIQQKKIKREVKKMMIAGIPLKELVHFQFDMNDAAFQKLEWEHSREFEYNHKMYDIVKADTVGNLVTYICFPDKQETALNAKFRKHLNDFYANNADQENSNKRLNNFINGFYCSHISFIYQCYPNIHLEKIGFYAQKLSLVYLDIEGPPPRFS
ncbi:MAG: hypothetical protein R2777_04990 [Chitinophagales bacterium]